MIKISSKEQIDKIVKSQDLPCFAIKKETLYRIYGPGVPKILRHSIPSEYEKECKRKALNSNVLDLKNRVFQPAIIKESELEILLESNGIGMAKYNNILNSINFYDEHVKVLLEKYFYVENPFYYLQKEKLARVRDNRIEIFECLDALGIEFIFGTLGNCKELAKKLETESRSHIEQSQFKKLRAIEEIIANFTTVDEAVNITDSKVLSKFILPYGKR